MYVPPKAMINKGKPFMPLLNSLQIFYDRCWLRRSRSCPWAISRWCGSQITTSYRSRISGPICRTCQSSRGLCRPPFPRVGCRVVNTSSRSWTRWTRTMWVHSSSTQMRSDIRRQTLICRPRQLPSRTRCGSSSIGSHSHHVSLFSQLSFCRAQRENRIPP